MQKLTLGFGVLDLAQGAHFSKRSQGRSSSVSRVFWLEPSASHLGRSMYHAISGRGNESTRIQEGKCARTRLHQPSAEMNSVAAMAYALTPNTVELIPTRRALSPPRRARPGPGHHRQRRAHMEVQTGYESKVS